MTAPKTTRTSAAKPAQRAAKRATTSAAAKTTAVAPEAAKGGLDLAALANAAQPVKELPKSSRSAATASPLALLVMRSFTEKQPFEMPAVAVGAAATLVAAVRRAATQVELGVTVRQNTTDEGVVVSFQGKAKGESA